MQKITILGLTGNIAGGKGTIAKAFQERGWAYFSFSQQVRNIAAKRNQADAARKVLQNIGNETREQFGNDILARLTAAEIFVSGSNHVVVDGIRNLGEVAYFRLCAGFILIAAVAPREKRFEWVLKRNLQSDSKTWEEFLAMDSRDMGEGEEAHGQQVKACIESADFIIPNNGSKEELVQKAAFIAEHWKGVSIL